MSSPEIQGRRWDVKAVATRIALAVFAPGSASLLHCFTCA